MTHPANGPSPDGRPAPQIRPGQHRRRFLASAAGALVGALAIPGCDLLSTSPNSRSQGARGRTTGGKNQLKEAPAIAKQVKQGQLPPLAKRLPDQPRVVKPFDRMGVYGGSLHNALLGSSDAVYVYLLTGYDQLLRFTPQWTGAAGTSELQLDVAAGYEASPDGTEFTFHLRRGMKWSDGHPFTADDVVFAVDDILLNTDLTPVPPVWFATAKGKAGQIAKLDDYSFKISFAEPAGLFLQQLATPSGPVLTTSPKHYLKQFHKKYNPDVDSLVKKAGFRDWVELFGAKTYAGSGTQNPDLPTISGWQLVVPLGGKTQQVQLKRNPYYFKTDTSGAQLPYIDEAIFDIVNDTEVMLLKTLQGDINIEAGPNARITNLRNKPIFARNRSKGKFHFVDAIDAHMNLICIYLNLTHKDRQKRELFQNKDFRVGLSYAINRTEIINTTMQRQGTPYQAAPLPQSDFYDAGLAHQYLTFDTDKANAQLDKVAPKKNSQGLRLFPDGKPIRFTIEYATSMHPEWPDSLDLIRGYWHDVGIDVSVRAASQELVRNHAAASEFDCTVWHGDGGLSVLLAPVNYFPMTPYNGWFAPAWGAWYASRGAQGEKPPAAPRRQMMLYDQLMSSAKATDQERLMKQILAIAREQFYIIGVVHTRHTYFIAADTLHNLPMPMIQEWYYPAPGPSRPEQYFFE